MPRKKKEIIEGISDKLEYLGLELDNIPKKLKEFEPLEFRVSRFYDEKQYRQYRYIDVKDIQILLSPTNRLTDLNEKYQKARPLCEYLDNKNEENLIKHTTFLNMLKNVSIEEIENVENEQTKLNREIPFKVKFQGNYLWQIYYSENTDKYFMIVPTEDKDYSTFFYVLKKQIEKKKAGKVFVPISNVDYSRELLNKTEIQSLENYLWLFTKDWASIYEVYDKTEKASLQIVGETEVYGKIKSQYKVKLSNKIEATKFFKLVKALFILQSELPTYYKFKTQIDKQGSLQFYYEDEVLEYDDLADWINDEYKRLLKIEIDCVKENNNLQARLKKLKEQTENLEVEYLSKEKQISTFLECKKSFFGKFKYYFKYSKKNNKNKVKKEENIDESKIEIHHEENEELPKKKRKKQNYTIEELVELYKVIELKENEYVEYHLEHTFENGYTLSGIIDHIYDYIDDYKTTSVWSVIYKSNYDHWKKQLQMGAYLFYKKTGVWKNKGRIIAILKDWNKKDSEIKQDYPKLPVEVIEFDLGTPEEIEEWIIKRFEKIMILEKLSDFKLPMCSMEERFNKGDKYAVKKKANKTATKIHDTKQEAEEHLKNLESKYPGVYEIEVRKGEDSKCLNYCSCNKVCPYYLETYDKDIKEISEELQKETDKLMEEI